MIPFRTLRRRNSRRSLAVGRSRRRRSFLAKFPWRGNLRPGCILLRPCLRGDREEIARTLCPAHLAMPLITAGLSKSGPLSPSLTRPDPNRILKRNLAAYGPQGEGAPRPTVFAEGDARNADGRKSGTSDESGRRLGRYGFPHLYRYPDGRSAQNHASIGILDAQYGHRRRRRGASSSSSCFTLRGSAEGATNLPMQRVTPPGALY